MSFPDKSNLKKMPELITLANRPTTYSNKPVIPGTPFLGGQRQLNCVLAADSRGHQGAAFHRLLDARWQRPGGPSTVNPSGYSLAGLDPRARMDLFKATGR